MDASVELGPASARRAGRLTVPPDAWGTVVFAHGTGSNHASIRDVRVAEAFQEAGLATFLFDLLDVHERRHVRPFYDMRLLSSRIVDSLDVIRADVRIGALPIALYGASTGAAAALWASVDAPDVRAIVSRGGVACCALPRLPLVSAPTLLIAGGDDSAILFDNRRALQLLRCERGLVVVAGATHLFPEPHALDDVARASVEWFTTHVRRRPTGDQPAGVP